MVQFDDTDSYLVIYLLPLALLVWACSHSQRALTVFLVMLGGILSFGLYFVVHKFWPGVFPVNSGTQVGIVLVSMLLFMFLVYYAAMVVCGILVVLVMVPTFQHNSQMFASALHAPWWVGMLVFCILLALLALVLVKASDPIINLCLLVVTPSLFLAAMLTLLWMESPPSMNQRIIACGDSQGDPPNRCPYSFADVRFLCIFGAFAVFSGVIHGRIRAERKRKEKILAEAEKKEQKLKAKAKTKKKQGQKYTAVSIEEHSDTDGVGT